MRLALAARSMRGGMRETSRAAVGPGTPRAIGARPRRFMMKFWLGAAQRLTALPAFGAVRLRMHDVTSAVSGYRSMDTALGPGSTTSVTNTAAGPATLQWTKTGGGTLLQWVSAPLSSAVTISGTVTFNTWALESATAANAGVRVTVQRDTASEQAAFITQAQGTELTTAISNRNFTASGYTPTAFSAGDRIVVKWWIADAGGTMGSGRSVTADYDGATAGADGETYVEFSDNPTFSDCAIPGRDGAGVVLPATVNAYWQGSNSPSAGSTSLTVGARFGAAVNIIPGDLLLIIQMQDASINSTNTSSDGAGVAGDPGSGTTSNGNTGLYEYVVATSGLGSAGGTLNIQGAVAGNGLVNAYFNANATATQGQRRWQVVRVPQYATATLSSTLTALPWQGTTDGTFVGGILALDVSGALTLGGTVSLDAVGFRGGQGRAVAGGAGTTQDDYVNLVSRNAHGLKAEGIAGTPQLMWDGAAHVDTGVQGYPNGDAARGAPGNAGGGGTDTNPSANDRNTGGGGGGNGGAGGLGGQNWAPNPLTDIVTPSRGGFGGVAFGSAAVGRLVIGGGGGAGSRNNSSASLSSGGVGGGIVLIRAASLSGTGTISARGGDGTSPDNDGGGGAGAGGTVVVVTNNNSTTGLTVDVSGGVGGNAWATQPFGTNGVNRHGPGGGGGGGVIYVSGTPSGATFRGGANGTTTTSLDAYGALPGAIGVENTNVPISQVSGLPWNTQCVAIPTSTPTI